MTAASGQASIAADMRAGLPILDMAPLLGHGDEVAREALARDIRAACHAERWDRASVHLFRGNYGDYLLAKVGRVFPALQAVALTPGTAQPS